MFISLSMVKHWNNGFPKLHYHHQRFVLEDIVCMPFREISPRNGSSSCTHSQTHTYIPILYYIEVIITQATKLASHLKRNSSTLVWLLLSKTFTENWVSKQSFCFVLVLTEEAYSHSGLQTRELGQTPSCQHG